MQMILPGFLFLFEFRFKVKIIFPFKGRLFTSTFFHFFSCTSQIEGDEEPRVYCGSDTSAQVWSQFRLSCTQIQVVKEWKRNNQKKQTRKYQDPQKTKVSTTIVLQTGLWERKWNYLPDYKHWDIINLNTRNQVP